MTMQGASEYTKISKEIGWERRDPIALPSKERAQELVRLAAAGERDAYKEIFKINRFGRSPASDSDLEIIDIIFTALGKYRPLFE